MSKHSPEPWEVVRDGPFIYIVPRRGIERTIAEMYIPINRDDVARMEQIEADTALMRAAPEMLFHVRGDAEARCLAPTFAYRNRNAVSGAYTDCGKCRTCVARALIAKINEEEAKACPLHPS